MVVEVYGTLFGHGSGHYHWIFSRPIGWSIAHTNPIFSIPMVDTFGKSIFMEYLYIHFTQIFWNVTHFYDIITFLKPKFGFFFWIIFYVCRLYFLDTRPRAVFRIRIWIEADQYGPQNGSIFQILEASFEARMPCLRFYEQKDSISWSKTLPR